MLNVDSFGGIGRYGRSWNAMTRESAMGEVGLVERGGMGVSTLLQNACVMWSTKAEDGSF